ncbi:MAG: anti-sigma factor [bacterium]
MTSPQPPRPLGDALRDALPTYQAPESLHAWARAQASTMTSTNTRTNERAGTSRRLRVFAYAAGIVLAAAIGSMSERYLDSARRDTDAQSQLVATLVDTHVRSLMADHLTDVQSSDRHTVKPWFAGKISFAPAVPELAPQGFPLVGGRVEYIAGRTAAALVYGRRLHTINLFIWPTSPQDDSRSGSTFNGYALEHWTAHGLSYWAVSDAAAAELQAFERAYTSSP